MANSSGDASAFDHFKDFNSALDLNFDEEEESVRLYLHHKFKTSFSKEDIERFYKYLSLGESKSSETSWIRKSEEKLKAHETYEYMLECLTESAIQNGRQKIQKKDFVKSMMKENFVTKTFRDSIPQELLETVEKELEEEREKAMFSAGGRSPFPDSMMEKFKLSKKSVVIDMASGYKFKGNANFKIQKFQQAANCYTLGIELNFDEAELRVQLLTNRAAANFHLGNIKSSLTDCESALKIKPDHLKALIRIMQCYRQLKRYDDALSWGQKGLKVLPSEKLLVEEMELTKKEKNLFGRSSEMSTSDK